MENGLTDEDFNIAAEALLRSYSVAEIIYDAVPVGLIKNNWDTKINIGYTTEFPHMKALIVPRFELDGKPVVSILNVLEDSLERLRLAQIDIAISLNALINEVLMVRKMRDLDIEVLFGEGSERWDMSDDEKWEYIAREKDNRVKKIYFHFELHMAHEFGHLLDYLQAGNSPKRLRKIWQNLQEEKKSIISSNAIILTSEEIHEYYSQPMEVRAERWKRYLYKKYYI